MMRNRFTRLAGVLLLAAILLPATSLAANSDKNRPSTVTEPTAPAASAPAGAGWEWTNPDTGITVTIPNGWEFEEEFGVPGFSRGAHYVGLVCENNPAGMSLAEYGKASRTALAGSVDLSGYEPGKEPSIYVATGKDKASGTPFTSVIAAVEASVCRLNYASLETGPDNDINDPELTKALFISAGYKPPAADWSNGQTGITVALPPDWMPVKPMLGLELLHTFQKGDLTAAYGCDIKDDHTLERYVTALKFKTGTFRFYDTHRLDDGKVFKLSGSYIKTGIPAIVFIKAVNGLYCHVLYRDESKTVSDVDEPAMTAALFASGAVRALPPDADIEKSSSLLRQFYARWVNPSTGEVTTLPAGWVPFESDDGVTFANYTEGYSALYFCDQLPAAATIEDYVKYLSDYNDGAVQFAPAVAPEGAEFFRIDGRIIADGKAMVYYAAKVPIGYCSLLYRSWLGEGKEPVQNPELTQAVFETLGVAFTAKWTNPETGITIPIPPGWDYARQSPTYFFNRTTFADLLCETPGDFADLQDYGQVVLATMEHDYDMSSLKPGAVPNTLVATGVGHETQKGFTTVLTKIGPRYCRIDYHGEPADGASDSSDPALTEVLFKSVGKPAEPAHEWTHKLTGRTITLPGGWIYEEGSEPPTFLNGDTIAGLGCDTPTPGIKTLDDYRAGVQVTYDEMYALEPFRLDQPTGTLIASGTMLSNSTPVTVVLADAGSIYCGLLYAHLGATGTENLNDPALSKVLFESARQ